jgi:serine protease inhibitor
MRIDTTKLSLSRARLSRGAAAAFITLALAGCSESSDPAGPDGPVAPITELPRALSATEQQLLRGSNTFAFKLAGQLLPTPRENLFYSPLSASMLLGMVLNGTNNRTYDQMRDALAFEGLSQEEINRGYADLIELLLELDPSVTIELANSVWAGQVYPILPDFLTRVRASFDAEAQTVNFMDPNTLGRINGWVDDKTNGRIEKILDEMPNGGDLVMILLNAIYFKANWTTQFDKARTQPEPFRRGDGSTVTADLMYLDATRDTARTMSVLGKSDVTLVDLPYGGGAFSMTLALPAAGSSVNSLVAGLTSQTWNAWMTELAANRRGAIVRLPRFELEWEKELNDPLKALGMTDVFDRGRADFSRLTPQAAYLSLVKQKSYVKVDEEGTEAAAVTIGVVAPTSAPPEIRFDRPFLFVLRERFTGTILFMGIINDPTA